MQYPLLHIHGIFHIDKRSCHLYLEHICKYDSFKLPSLISSKILSMPFLAMYNKLFCDFPYVTAPFANHFSFGYSGSYNFGFAFFTFKHFNSPSFFLAFYVFKDIGVS